MWSEWSVLVRTLVVARVTEPVCRHKCITQAAKSDFVVVGWPCPVFSLHKRWQMLGFLNAFTFSVPGHNQGANKNRPLTPHFQFSFIQ